MPFKSRQTQDLVRGRVSGAGTTYFLTWCPTQRAPLLANAPSLVLARQCLAACDSAGAGTLLAGTVMPDHIHFLVELGPRLTVSQLVAKTKAAITRSRPGMKWQLNFFEHRMRTDESTEAYAFYIFMNPYVADLCPLERIWVGWIPSLKVRWEFEEKLREGSLPQPEWVEEARRFSNTLPPGAD
jgi:REP element-mobilizing transposase RayT